MRVGTARDLGALVRERRRKQGLSQEDLAKAIGVSRQWVIGLEHGSARNIGAALRALRVLGLVIDIIDDDALRGGSGSVDLDELLSKYDDESSA